jgi:hypothetical protein
MRRGRAAHGRLAYCRAVAVLVVLLWPATARADRHTADVGGGGGRAARSGLWGVGVTGDWIPKGGDWLCQEPSSPHHACTLGLAGEFNWAKGDHEGGTLSQYVFQLGPRITYNKLAHRNAQLFLVALPGITVEKNVQNRTSFSIATGGGADFPLPFFEKQIDKEKARVWVARLQVTWNWIDNGRPDDSYWHVGLSLLYRFE